MNYSSILDFDNYNVNNENFSKQTTEFYQKNEKLLIEKANPMLFSCILNLMDENYIYHESNEYFTANELNSIVSKIVKQF